MPLPQDWLFIWPFVGSLCIFEDWSLVRLSSAQDHRGGCWEDNLFRASYDHYEFLVMPFVLTNAPNSVHGSREPSVQSISRSVCDCFCWWNSDLLEVLRRAWVAFVDNLADFVRTQVVHQAIQVRVLAVWGSISWPHVVASRHISRSNQGWHSSQMRVRGWHQSFGASWVMRPTMMVHTGFLLDNNSSHVAN